MLGYTEFRAIVEREFMEYLPEEFKDLEVSSEMIDKVNKAREALCFRDLSSRISAFPTLYYDDFYEHYLQHGDISLILKSMVDIFVEASKRFCFDMEDTEWLKSNVVMTLVNKEANMHLLDKVPHREFLDLAIIYRIICDTVEEGFISFIVENDFMDGQLGLNENELYDLARENTPRLLPVNELKMPSDFYVLTNENKIYGAAVILYENVLEEYTEKLGGDILILPSSIHECIIVPVDGVDVENMRALVKDANDTILEEGELLSYSVYKYCKDEKVMRIA